MSRFGCAAGALIVAGSPLIFAAAASAGEAPAARALWRLRRPARRRRQHAGMVWIAGGTFTMGADEERPGGARGARG